MRRTRRAAPLHRNAALEDDVVEADEPEITRVDTSHMGKIGKMAHFIGSRAADEEETDEPEKAEPDTTDSHENVEEKDRCCKRGESG